MKIGSARSGLLSVIFTLTLLSLFWAPATAFAEKAVWKLALEEVDDSFQDRMAQELKRIIQKKSNGTIELEVYPYGTLGTSAQITEQLMSEIVQLAFQSAGEVGSFVPEIQIFSVDYLMPVDTAKLANVLLRGEEHKKILQECFAQKDIKMLGEFYEGWQIWTANKPLKSAADLKGFKMRVMPSPMLVAAFRAYDANPTPIPYAEVYSALQLKMIDGQVNPYFAIQEMKFYEVQNYMINSRQLMFIATMTANLDFYNELSDEHRTILDEAVQEVIEWSFTMEEEYAKERRAMILQAKPAMVDIELTPEEIAPLQARAGVIKNEYLKIGGPRAQEVLSALERDIKKYGN